MIDGKGLLVAVAFPFIVWAGPPSRPREMANPQFGKFSRTGLPQWTDLRSGMETGLLREGDTHAFSEAFSHRKQIRIRVGGVTRGGRVG